MSKYTYTLTIQEHKPDVNVDDSNKHDDNNIHDESFEQEQTEPKTEPKVKSGANNGDATGILNAVDAGKSSKNGGSTRGDSGSIGGASAKYKDPTGVKAPFISINSGPKCLGRHALNTDWHTGIPDPLVITVQTSATADNRAYTLQAAVVRGLQPIEAEPIEAQPKKKNIFQKAGGKIKGGYNKVVKDPIKKSWTI
jgi:hypothetical protein